MVTRNKPADNPKQNLRGLRIRGLSDAARKLGVSRTHLSLVLHGHRESASLSRRYRELAGKAAASKAGKI